MTHFHLFIEQALCYCYGRRRHCRFFLMHRFDTFNCFTSNAVHIDIENVDCLFWAILFIAFNFNKSPDTNTDNTVIYMVLDGLAWLALLFFIFFSIDEYKKEKQNQFFSSSVFCM